MTRLTGKQVTVAGAGALGLVIALTLARRGAQVTVCDPAAPGDNASGVAAGMLAPVFEAALDPAAAGHLDLFRAARDGWTDFAPVALNRTGALWRGPDAAGMEARLDALGARWRRTPEGPFTDEDWRLDPGAAMTVLFAQAARAGVRFETRAVEVRDVGPLVVATGAGGQGLAPELDHLTPIKGHILRVAGGPASGPVLRGAGVYLCPDPAAAVLGATMEFGRFDLRVEADQVAALKHLGESLWPGISGLRARAETGVRVGTPDGLPLVGPSRRDGVLLAVGARRNGWLLAPLVAQVIAAYFAGDDPGRWAARLDPRRFDNKDTDA
ncbi:MAG: FAD-dependent oxidoreductase [Caulobacter sp.]|nr:FAD-dependent oxidoreductase [Caulobacter sp.]